MHTPEPGLWLHGTGWHPTGLSVDARERDRGSALCSMARKWLGLLGDNIFLGKLHSKDLLTIAKFENIIE